MTAVTICSDFGAQKNSQPLLPHLLHHAKCRWDDSQAGIKITGRKINNLKYAGDTMIMAERKEELKSFLMKVKE